MSQHFFSNPQHSAIDSARTPLLTRRAALGAALAGAAALIALPAQARAAATSSGDEPTGSKRLSLIVAPDIYAVRSAI